MYLLSIIPSSFSNLWKEITFKNIVVDMWHLQTMVCIGQLIAGVIMAPLASLLVCPSTPFCLDCAFIATL